MAAWNKAAFLWCRHKRNFIDIETNADIAENEKGKYPIGSEQLWYTVWTAIRLDSNTQ